MSRHIKGGQGRSEDDIRSSAFVVSITAIALVVFLLVALIWEATNG